MWIGEIPFKSLGMIQEKLDLLKELSRDGGYWLSVRAFIDSIEGRRLDTLTLRQRNWITEIILSLDIELQRRAWRYQGDG